MNNQQWPPPRGGGAPTGPPNQSPWSHPDASWSPQTYRDTPGRDPRQPFGTAPQQGAAPEQGTPPGISQFEAPRGPDRRALTLGLVIVAAIVALVLVLQFTGGFSSDEPAANPTPSIQGTEPGLAPQPAATGGTSIPFEGNGTGIFEILSQNWSDEGLRVEYRITLDEGQGERSFSLYMFSNSTLEVADPTTPQLATASAGQPYTGTVEFAVDQSKSTLVLASSFGAALTALPIPA